MQEKTFVFYENLAEGRRECKSFETNEDISKFLFSCSGHTIVLEIVRGVSLLPICEEDDNDRKALG
jgi:hypothetical protein